MKKTLVTATLTAALALTATPAFAADPVVITAPDLSPGVGTCDQAGVIPPAPTFDHGHWTKISSDNTSSLFEATADPGYLLSRNTGPVQSFQTLVVRAASTGYQGADASRPCYLAPFVTHDTVKTVTKHPHRIVIRVFDQAKNWTTDSSGHYSYTLGAKTLLKKRVIRR